MYGGWSKRSYSRVKKSWLAHLSAQNVFFVYHITSVLFFKSDKSETKVFYNKTLRSVHVGFIGDAFSKFKLLL